MDTIHASINWEQKLAMRIRITILPTRDRTNDLRIAANVRRDLWAHLSVKIDPDNPLHGTHRDEKECAYFEFSTDDADEVKRVLGKYGHTDHVDLGQVNEPIGQA